MGLLFQFPVEQEDQDFFHIDASQTPAWRIAKSYGLPPIFWFYLMAIIVVVCLLVFAAWGPMQKLLQYPGIENQLIVYGLIATVLFGLGSLITFYFYQKVIATNGKVVEIAHKLFGICISKKTYDLHSNTHTLIKHFMDSPNMAKKVNLPETRGFQNKGYFQLWLKLGEQEVFLDRSSRKVDLIKLTKLLFDPHEIRHIT